MGKNIVARFLCFLGLILLAILLIPVLIAFVFYFVLLKKDRHHRKTKSTELIHPTFDKK